MNPTLKSTLQYFSGLAIGFALLSAACWVDGAYAAQSKEDKLADKYVQATTDAVDKYLDEQHIVKDPSTRLKITLEVLRDDYNKGIPSERACQELHRYTRKPCTEAYMAFWKAYKKVDEE